MDLKSLNHNVPKKWLITIIIFAFNLSLMVNVFAVERTVDLVVAYKTVNFAGKNVQAIAVNNQIPAPTLHFHYGDKVTINVCNNLDKGTAIHWHGILVPWQMDGVEGITQKGIPPGGVFHYRFTLRQSGTYWYHAHAGLQEQQGLYGGFIVDPPRTAHYKYTKDYVIVLSDWSNSLPEQIYANLKKDGDYYSPRLPLQPSLFRFTRAYYNASPEERKKILEDYKMMQQMRMSIYDISDVAYDAFLLNGQSCLHPWTAPVKVGDTVRLRFIGAGGSTNFHVKIPRALMRVIQVDGNDIKPYPINDFMISPGETYDVLVKINEHRPYVIYAESADTLGAAYGALTTSLHQSICYKNVTPFAEPLPVTREMMANAMPSMESESHAMTMSMDQRMSTHSSMPMKMPMHSTMFTHSSMPMKMPMHPTMSTHSSMPMKMPMHLTMNKGANELATASHMAAGITTGTKYQNIVAQVKTNDPNKPVQIIKMDLFGYMHHFIWMINGLPEYKSKPILIEPGNRYRIIFTNDSMMHHPMHIHGHWFILRNGHGAYDPLLHTIDVPPGATVVADFDADASGQWFFHCHHLYHMVAGMADIFQYTTIIDVINHKIKPENEIQETRYVNRPIIRVDEQIPINPGLIKHPEAHHQELYFASKLDLGADPFHNRQKLTFKGLYGGDYHKLELFMNDAEINKGKIENTDIDVFYWHLIDQFWAIKGGANYFYRPALTPYWQPGIGIEGLMPYFIDTDFRMYYHSGSVKFDLELLRDTQITNNFFVRAGIRSILATKTVPQDSVGSGINQMRYIVRPYYRIAPGMALFSELEHVSSYGAFTKIIRSSENSASENTLTFGVSLLF